MRDRLIELLDNATVEKTQCYPDGIPALMYCGKAVNRNTAIQLADKILADGWFRPPCNVGDKVYYVSEKPLNLSVQANTIYEADVVRIVTTHLGTSLVIQIRNEYGCTEIPDVNDWGKTVFLTKEEALSFLRECGLTDKQVEKVVKGGVQE